MWYFSAKWNDFDPDTWVARAGYQDKSDFTIYVYCFYFAMTVITTVGYGDMPINTSYEKILAVFIIIVGVITFSFAIGSLMSVLENLDSSEAKLKQKHFELNSIQKKYKIPSELYYRIFKSLKFKIEQEMEAERFMKTLPVHLRSELDLEINREIISRIPYFKEKSPNFCAAAVPHLKTSKVYMGDYIFLKGEPIYEIYFLLSGSAGYTLSDDNITYIF